MKTTTKLLATLGIAGLAGLSNTTCLAEDSTPAPAPIVSDGQEWRDAGKDVKAAEFLKQMPPGSTVQSGPITMRDGVKLATDVFLPPGGKPTCVVLGRTPYGRPSGAYSAVYTNIPKPIPCVVVAQDSRGTGDSKGKIEFDNVNEIQDAYDTLDWIAKQPWCNGRIGMTGGSGNGTCAAMAYLCKHPNLVVVMPDSTAGNMYPYWSFENGVRRWMYSWLVHRNLKTPPWPRPTLYEKFDAAKWQAIMDEAAKDNKTVYIEGSDGWFNLFGDYTFDFFTQFAKTGHVSMIMGTRTHGMDATNIHFKINDGKDKDSKDKSAYYDSTRDFFGVLEGKKTVSKSYLKYAVLGDYTDPGAPGNIWRYTESWPPPSTPLSLYFTQDGKLVKETPPKASGAVSYTYDPKDPAPSIGCCYSYGPVDKDMNGAYDQRPLANRKDVIRFVSDPLTEPLEIGGKLKAELFVSSDAPDTTFMVKFVDIYPDGQKIILRESAIMARYWNGVAHDGKPLKPGEIRKLDFPCNSMAAVFNKGHRIGIFITSSSAPAYEVHPNTFEPVDSMDKAVVAHQTIHCGESHTSRVILPVITAPAGR